MMELPKMTVTLDTRMANLAIAALRYLEAREATAAARKVRYDLFADVDPSAADSAHRAVMSAGARQSAAMRGLKRCAKQVTGGAS